MSAYSTLLAQRRFTAVASPAERSIYYAPHPDSRAYFVPASFSWPSPSYSVHPDHDDLSTLSYPASDDSSWATHDPYPSRTLHPILAATATTTTTIHTSADPATDSFFKNGSSPRSLSSSPNSSTTTTTTTTSSTNHISTPRDWPITPNTSTAIDDLFPSHPSPRSTNRSSPLPPCVVVPVPNSVKVEPEDTSDGCFIMENPDTCAGNNNGDNDDNDNDDDDDDNPATRSKLASFVSSQILAPPTEVPLRASQAPKKMKEMMGAFRVNPFAMHTGSEGKGAAPTVSWEPGPLEEEPLMFEFQLDLVGYDIEGRFEGAESDGGVRTHYQFDEADKTKEVEVDGGVQQQHRQREQEQEQGQDPAFRLSNLHTFPPGFELGPGFNADTRERNAQISIPQLPEEHVPPPPSSSSSSSMVLLPQCTRESSLAVEHRSQSSGNNTWDFESHSANMSSSHDIATQSSVGGATQNVPMAHDEYQASNGYPASLMENTTSVVVETTEGMVSCSYPSLVQVSQANPSSQSNFQIPLDPEGDYQHHHHHHDAGINLGLYVSGGGGDYGRSLVEAMSGTTTTVSPRVAHSVQANQVMGPALRHSARKSHRLYEQHPYLRPIAHSNKLCYPIHGRERGGSVGYHPCEQDTPSHRQTTTTSAHRF